MDMVYDTIHNIAVKNQLHTIIQPSQHAITQKKTSYNFAYVQARNLDIYSHPITGQMGQWGDNSIQHQARAELYNAVQGYRASNPAYANDMPMVYNDIAEYDPAGVNLGHQTHGRADAVDFRYMDRNGQPTANVNNADLTRQNAFTRILGQHGFNQ